MPGQCRPLIGQYLIIPGCDWLVVVTCDDVMLSLHNRNVGGGRLLEDEKLSRTLNSGLTFLGSFIS